MERPKRYSKRNPSKDSRKIYIICEGLGTEPQYFKFFENLSSNLSLIVIPPENGTDPLKLIELAERNLLGESRRYTLDFREHDTIWFAIDTDSWEKEGKIQPLREFCERKNREITQRYDEVKYYHAWNVAQSNPCFEIWLYYHFYESKPKADEVEEYRSMKAFVDSKISGGFNPLIDQVRLKDAISNSESNFVQQENGDPDLYSTEQHLLGKEILPFVNSELQKRRNKF
jgi:hypothetical protein